MLATRVKTLYKMFGNRITQFNFLQLIAGWICQTTTFKDNTLLYPTGVLFFLKEVCIVFEGIYSINKAQV